MDKKYTILIVVLIVSNVTLVIWNTLYSYAFRYSYTKLFYVRVFIMGGVIFSAVIIVLKLRKLEKGRKLGEDLFLKKFGAIPDKVKVLSAFTYKYDQIAQGISAHSVRIKFLSQEKVYKGIVDIEKKKLYIKEPIQLPMHTGDSVHVWKDVTAVYRNKMPKRVEYRDADEDLCGIDHFDEKGNLKKGSLRRYKGREVYWFPEKKAWVP